MQPNRLVHPKILLKTTLLFFSANALNLSLHEVAHATIAWSFKVPATLFHFYVNIDHNQASRLGQVLIPLAGPLFSLLVGILSWKFYNKSKIATPKLFLFYSAIVGISIFFGNLFSTAFVGDFNRAARWLHLSRSLQYLFSTLGIATLTLVMFVAGRKFLNAGLFDASGKSSIVINGLAIPWLLGTGLLIVVYTPLPSQFVMGIITSSLFWILSIVGAATANRVANTDHFSKVSLTVADLVLFLISIVLVRILVPGIHFTP